MPTPEPTKAPSQDGTIDCFHTALFTGTNAANQVEMNKIRKYGNRKCSNDATVVCHTDDDCTDMGTCATYYGDGLTAPLAPGASIFANIEYWPLDRYSSGRGTARGDGTFRKGRAKEGALRWSDDNDQGRFVYPYVDGPIASTDGALRGGGTAKPATGDPYAGECLSLIHI